MCIHYKLKITGKVQGVWCRKYIFDKASEWKINGYVKNNEDGSVLTEIETNDPKKAQAFIEWLYECSPLSKVEKVEVIEEKECSGFKDFQIIR